MRAWRTPSLRGFTDFAARIARPLAQGSTPASIFSAPFSWTPELADAEFGLGLYNYYADTLSGIAKLLSFFMGIPGGNKQEGIRQLEHDISEGVLTPSAARFYLALDLHRYDQQYEKALTVIGPLAEKYPSNPLFQLARGDLYAKLGRKAQALMCYRTAAALPVQDAACRTRIQELVRASLAAQGIANGSGTR